MNKQAENIDRLTDFALNSFGIANPIKEKEQEEETFTMYAVCPVCNKVNVFDISDEEYEANCWYSCTYCEKEIQLHDYTEITEDEVKVCPICKKSYPINEFEGEVCMTCYKLEQEIEDDGHDYEYEKWRDYREQNMPSN